MSWSQIRVEMLGVTKLTSRKGWIITFISALSQIIRWNMSPRTKRIGETIFLQIHPDVLKFEGVKFSDGVSNKSDVQIHPIEEAKKLIDFEVLFTRTEWRDSAIQNRLQQAEKCKILIPNHIPLEFIRNIPNG